MRIERAGEMHIEPWVAMRAALWPGATQLHRDEITAYLPDHDGAAAFVAFTDASKAIGFAESSLRTDYVNGCTTSPVLFLEGIYVMPAERRQGAARLLCDAVVAWGKSRGCTEFASDALLDNLSSHRFHAALGFEEAERVVYFRKSL